MTVSTRGMSVPSVNTVDDAGDFTSREGAYNGGAIFCFTGYDGRPGDSPGDFLRLFYADREDQRRACGQFPVCLCDSVGCSIHRLRQLSGGIVSVAGANTAQVVPDIHPPTEDIRKIIVLDSPSEVPLKDDILVDIVQTDLVATPGRRRESQVQARLEVVKDPPVGFGRRVVRLVGDDEVELIRGEPVQAARKALHRRAHYFIRRRGMVRALFDAAWTVEVFERLPHQFLSVRKDKRAALTGDIGKGYRLSQPGGHLYEIRSRALRLDDVYTFCLIIP